MGPNTLAGNSGGVSDSSSSTNTCGVGITGEGLSGSLPAPTDGTEGDTNIANLNDTENTLAPKDVVLLLTHGVCVLPGATTTIIKSGKLGKICANHLGNACPLDVT